MKFTEIEVFGVNRPLTDGECRPASQAEIDAENALIMRAMAEGVDIP